MSTAGSFTLGKEERLCSKTLIERLFSGGGSKSLSSFPLRVVCLQIDCSGQGGEPEVPVKMMVSVSKRHFRHAVSRNRVKRQVREAYRLNKAIVATPMGMRPGRQLLLAFIWLADKQYNTEKVRWHVRNLLERIADQL